MFDSLDEQMKLDAAKESSRSQRLMLWLLIAIVSIVVFGGLILGVHWMNT